MWKSAQQTANEIKSFTLQWHVCHWSSEISIFRSAWVSQKGDNFLFSSSEVCKQKSAVSMKQTPFALQWKPHVPSDIFNASMRLIPCLKFALLLLNFHTQFVSRRKTIWHHHTNCHNGRFAELTGKWTARKYQEVL